MREDVPGGLPEGLLLKSIITHGEERSVVERKKKRSVSMQDVTRHFGDALGRVSE